MNTETGTLDALVEEKLNADTAFQGEIASFTDEEKTAAIDKKRSEVREAEFARLRKSDELATNYKTRAEKAEKQLKEKTGEAEPAAPQPRETDLTGKEIYALQEAKVPLDDVDEVVKAAKILGVSVPDALKDETVKTLLANRAEKRASAQAATTGRARSSVSTPSDDDLIKQASEGKIPAKGSKEAEQLFWARRGGKKS